MFEGSYPNPYASIPFLYTPGIYLAYLLTAHSTWMQTWAPYTQNNHPLLLHTHLDRNLFLTLLCPLLAAVHLVYQVVQYPGPRREMWTTMAAEQEERFLHFQTGIYVSAKFCISALGIQIVLLGWFYKSRAHQKMICSASLSTTLCLCFAACFGQQPSFAVAARFFHGIRGVLISILVFPGTFMVVYWFLVLLLMVCWKMVLVAQAFLQMRVWRVVKGVVWCGALVPLAGVGFSPVVVGVWEGNLMVMPKLGSGGGGLEEGWCWCWWQVVVVVVGVVNFGVSVRGLVGERVEFFRRDIPKQVGWSDDVGM